MAGVVWIPWYATVFRHEAFSAEVARVAPLVLRFLWPDRRAVLAWAAALAATAAAVILPPLLMWGWEPVWAPYHYQLSRIPFPPTKGEKTSMVLLAVAEWFRFGKQTIEFTKPGPPRLVQLVAPSAEQHGHRPLALLHRPHSIARP